MVMSQYSAGGLIQVSPVYGDHVAWICHSSIYRLTKDGDGRTDITFMDGSKLTVTDSINTIVARMESDIEKNTSPG